MSEAPHVSIVIPVYNEEEILETAITDLRAELADKFDWSYEIIVAENGSTDRTVALAQEMAASDPVMHTLSAGEPNYGLALRRGIQMARGRFVICDEIDLCDTDFYERALDLLERDEADLVVGSKSMPGARDERPVFRRAATRVINGALRVAVGFEGTDTHGLKALRREALLRVVDECVVDKDLFASELVVRAWRGGDTCVVEIPVRVSEKRRPSINLIKRVPNVLKNLARLTYVIRFGGGD